jgi:hypothetical protein
MALNRGFCVEGGHFFTDLDEVLFEELLSMQPEVEPQRVWLTDDVWNNRRARQRWLNAIVRLRGSNTVE